MCTVNDEDGDGLMKEKEVYNEIGSSCRKCDVSKAEVILKGKDPYCRSCFLVYVTHKFRASLGKSKMVRKGDKVLVGFSGSASSLALLHLIKAGIEEDAHKRLVFEPFIIYIDEGAALNAEMENRRNVLCDIVNTLKPYNVVSYFANLESIFHPKINGLYSILYSDVSASLDSKLSLLFSKIKSLTSKEELLLKLRNNFLLSIAADLGCNKILTAETTSNTASKLLTNISLGRGAQLPFDIGFCDSREKNVKILRPMQDFGKEEIEFYCTINNLKPVEAFSFKLSDDSTSSIQMLTRKFVDELQENFPSTISTVYRTGAKLTVESEAAEAMETCSLCMGPLDTNVTESSSLQATVYSSLISKCGPSGENLYSGPEQAPKSIGFTCNGDGKECNCMKNDEEIYFSKEEAMGSLCYGCRLIVDDIGSLSLLPDDVIKSIKENSTLRLMKNEIKDFLL